MQDDVLSCSHTETDMVLDFWEHCPANEIMKLHNIEIKNALLYIYIYTHTYTHTHTHTHTHTFPLGFTLSIEHPAHKLHYIKVNK